MTGSGLIATITITIQLIIIVIVIIIIITTIIIIIIIIIMRRDWACRPRRRRGPGASGRTPVTPNLPT